MTDGISEDHIEAIVESMHEKLHEPDNFFTTRPEWRKYRIIARIPGDNWLTENSIGSNSKDLVKTIAHAIKNHQLPLVRKVEFDIAGERYFKRLIKEREGEEIQQSYQTTLRRLQTSSKFRQHLDAHGLMTPRFTTLLNGDDRIAFNYNIRNSELVYTAHLERARVYVLEHLVKNPQEASRTRNTFISERAVDEQTPYEAPEEESLEEKATPSEEQASKSSYTASETNLLIMLHLQEELNEMRLAAEDLYHELSTTPPMRGQFSNMYTFEKDYVQQTIREIKHNKSFRDEIAERAQKRWEEE